MSGCCYEDYFYCTLADNGTPIEFHSSHPVFSIDDVRSSSIKEYGAFYLLNHIAQQTDLLVSLQEAVQTYWQELFMLTCYLISSGDPFLYCESWFSDTACLPVGNMTSQRISERLSAVTSMEYLALDITSVSSYFDNVT